MDEQMPQVAANGQATTAGRGRAVASTAITPDDSAQIGPAGSAVYRSLYATEVEEAAPAAPAVPKMPYPRSAAEAHWADFAAPAEDFDPDVPAQPWAPPSARGRVTVPSAQPIVTRKPVAGNPEPVSPPFPPEPPARPEPPMPTPEPFEPAPPPPAPPPVPEPPAPTPQPPSPPQPPFPQPPGPPQPPTPPGPQPPGPPFPPPPPSAYDDEDLDRPLPVVTATPTPVIPRQVTPVSGGAYAQDDWRSHVAAAAPTSPAPHRGTVYGSRTVSEDTPEVADSAASTA